MADVVTLLSAVSANGTGPVFDAGDLKGHLTVQVFTTGTVSALSVQLQGSIDKADWVSIGSPVTTVTAADVSSGVLMRYFRGVLSSYSGTGTVTAYLALAAGAAAAPVTSAAPSGAAGGALTGTYPNPGLATVPIGSGGTGQTSAAAALSALGGAAVAGDIGGTSASPQVTATHLSSALPVAQGGTGAAAQQAAIDALTGTQSTGKVLRSDGTHATLSAIQAADVPTLNQSTTGTAAGLSATLAIASGGTNATTAAAALTSLGAAALAGATFTGWTAPAVVALTDASTITVNAALGDDQRVTLGGNRTLGAPSNPVDGQQIIFQVTQDGTGSRTLAYASGAGGYSFSAQLPSPTLSVTAGAVDLLKFIYNAAKNRWLFCAYLGGF